MEIDRTVGFADWPQTEVVGPADHHPLEPFHDRLRILPDFVTPGFVADRSTNALHSFLRGYRALIDPAPPHRVTPPERVCLVGFSFTTVGVEVFLGNGDGSFTQVPGTLATGDQTSGIVVADFNGDGKLDLAFADAAGSTSNVQVMLGKGDGTFVPAQGSPIQMPGFQPIKLLVADFLNHGKLDLVVTGNPQTGSNLTFLPGNGDGTSQSAIALNFGGALAAGDFNGSGRLGFADGRQVVIQP